MATMRRFSSDGAEGDASYIRLPLVQAADWIGLICMTSCVAVLGYKLLSFKPPTTGVRSERNVLYYFGYNEKGMISLYVNLIAAFAYYAKMASHISGDPVKGNIVYYQYFDYMFTCPLLTLDLLWTLNLPYKVTYALLVFLTLFSGFASSGHPQPGRWMWFAYGMVMFTFTWLRIVGLVQVRFLQYFAKKDSMLRSSAQGQRMSISEQAGFRKSAVRQPLQFALSVYFTIWMIYPILWLLLEGEIISKVVAHCCNVVMDVLAKSMYGFALLKFQLIIDKTQVEFSELTVTKAELLDELMQEKKQVRKTIMAADEAELQRRRDLELDDDNQNDEVIAPTMPNLGSLNGTANKKKKQKKRDPSPKRSPRSPLAAPNSMPLFPTMPPMAAGSPLTSVPTQPAGQYTTGMHGPDLQPRTNSWRDV